MRITMKKHVDAWNPRITYSIMVDGVKVGNIHCSLQGSTWDWYASVGGVFHSTIGRREGTRVFPSAKAALDDFKAWRKALCK